MARSETLAHVFEQPTCPVHRRFEVCRAYFLNRLTAPAIAHRFGLHVGTVQAIVRDFAANPDLDQFFRSTQPGRKTSPKREALSERALELRRQGRSVGQIRVQLGAEGHPVSESYLAAILRSQGFLPLRGRGRPPRPGASARDGSEVPAMADIRELSLKAGRTLPTQAAGLFLFLPLLLDGHFSQAVQAAGYPGTQQSPALQAMLSLLAPKLLGKRRVSHVSDLCTAVCASLHLMYDEGAGLFAGLNVLPKTTYATAYSYQTERPMNERLVDELTRQMPLKEPRS
jgi:transposase